jgi:putative two-component system response regulator
MIGDMGEDSGRPPSAPPEQPWLRVHGDASAPTTILVADDEDSVRALLVRILERDSYRVVQAGHGDEVLPLVEREDPALLILDITMPGMNGIEICRQVKADPRYRLLPVVHVTSLADPEDAHAAIEAGSDEFFRKPFDAEALLLRVRSLLRTKRMTDALVDGEAVLVALARTVEARDHYTEQHLFRVAERAVNTATYLGLSGSALEAVRLGGLLHDLGKIAVPDAVLLKPGPLTEEEYEIIKVHPERGAEIVRPLRIRADPVMAVLHHHERWDGDGYPYGLRGAAIPLAARIIAVADSFDALTTDRPYRDGTSPDRAFEVLRAGRATQWDPEVIDAFLELYGGATPARRR